MTNNTTRISTKMSDYTVLNHLKNLLVFWKASCDPPSVSHDSLRGPDPHLGNHCPKGILIFWNAGGVTRSHRQDFQRHKFWPVYILPELLVLKPQYTLKKATCALAAKFLKAAVDTSRSKWASSANTSSISPQTPIATAAKNWFIHKDACPNMRGDW